MLEILEVQTHLHVIKRLPGLPFAARSCEEESGGRVQCSFAIFFFMFHPQIPGILQPIQTTSRVIVEEKGNIVLQAASHYRQPPIVEFAPWFLMKCWRLLARRIGGYRTWLIGCRKGKG